MHPRQPRPPKHGPATQHHKEYKPHVHDDHEIREQSVRVRHINPATMDQPIKRTMAKAITLVARTRSSMPHHSSGWWAISRTPGP